jgi:hypothetical protein
MKKFLLEKLEKMQKHKKKLRLKLQHVNKKRQEKLLQQLEKLQILIRIQELLIQVKWEVEWSHILHSKVRNILNS